MKSRWFLGLASGLLAAALLGGLSFVVVRYFGQKESNSTPSTSTLPPEPQILEETSSPGGSVIRRLFSNNRVYYSLRGTFVSPLVIRERTIQGNFQIDADPEKSSVGVIISAVSGTVQIGYYNGSFDGDVEMVAVTPEAIQSRVRPGEPTLLYIIAGAAGSTSTQALLDRLVAGDWSAAASLLLYPNHLGVVVQ